MATLSASKFTDTTWKYDKAVAETLTKMVKNKTSVKVGTVYISNFSDIS